MHTLHLLALIGIPLFFSGCAGKAMTEDEEEMVFSPGTGDMGQFMLQHAIKRGGRPVKTNDLPVIEGEWKYSEDQFGVVLQLGPERFPEVAAFLREAFGDPSEEPGEIIGGGELGWYAVKEFGVGIQFVHTPEHTQVIVLRQLTEDEFMPRLEKALEDTMEDMDPSELDELQEALEKMESSE